MTYEDIVSGIPGEFFKNVQGAIRNGFYVSTDIDGYPITGMPMSIRLKQGDDPVLRFSIPETTETVVIDGYDILTLMLDFQSAVLQGFDVDVDSVILYPVGHSYMILKRPEKVTFDLGAATTDEETTEKADKPKRKKKEI